MRGPGRILIPLLAATLVLAGLCSLPGCGSDPAATTASGPGSGDSGAAEPAADDAGRSETAEPPAPLPSGWKTVVNRSGGFSVGLPPGWSSARSEGGQGSIVSSPDDLVTATITADRTAGALELPLGEFAKRTAQALGSAVVGADRFDDLFVTRPAPFKVDRGYEAAAVRASGRSARTGVKELIFVVVVRRPGIAAYVVISRENAQRKSALASRDDVKTIVRSLRGRPVG